MMLFALRAPGVSAVLKHGSVLYLRLRSVRCRQNAKRYRSGADNFVQMVGRPHISFECNLDGLLHMKVWKPYMVMFCDPLCLEIEILNT